MVELACLPQAGVWVLKLRKFLNKFIPWGEKNPYPQKVAKGNKILNFHPK